LSRPLVVIAALGFLLTGLLPVLVMLGRVDGASLASLGDPRILSLLGRTLLLGCATAGLALLLGVPFGFLVARTDLPGASWLRPLGVVPLLLPPLLIAISWSALSDLRGAPSAILCLAASTFPLVALFTARAFERIDARREEAALVAGGLRAVLRMELPLVLPAALCGACLAFTFAVNDFSVPDFVSSVGVKFNVYADEIFFNWTQVGEPGLAVATALPLIALSLGALLPVLALRRRGALATLDSDFARPAPLRLGRLRWPAFAFALGLVVLAGLAPLARLAWEASGGPRTWRHDAVAAVLAGEEPPDAAELPARTSSPAPLEDADGAPALTWSQRLAAAPRVLPEQWAILRRAFAQALERSREDLRNSIAYAGGAALLTTLAGLVLGHALERARRRRLARALEALALLPLAAPAVLFGIGAIVLWNRDWSAAFYDGGWMVVALFAGRFAAFAILIQSGAVASLDRELEESAALCGAGPARRLVRVVAPALRGTLAGSFVLVFVFAMRELDAAILVPAANHTAVLRVYNGVHFGRDDYVAALALLLAFAILLPGLLWSLFARRRLEVLP